MLEQLSVSSPRKGRKALLKTMERVERMLDTVDDEWCDGICQCTSSDHESLSAQLVSVRDMSSTSSVSLVSNAVAALLDELDRCGDAVLQSLAVLRSAASGGSGTVLDAFGVLRGLCEERLEAASADECAAFDAVLSHLASSPSCDESEVESGCVSLFKLGCRNGLAVCARSEVLELATARYVETVSMVGSSSTVGGLRACSAVGLLWFLILQECSYKASADVQAALVPLGTSGLKAVVRAISKAFTAEGACALSLDTLRFGLMDDPELCIACGAACTNGVVLLSGFISTCVSQLDDAGYFAAALTLHRRVMPSPLPASWWVSTHDVIDATSVYLSGSAAMMCAACLLYTSPSPRDRSLSRMPSSA